MPTLLKIRASAWFHAGFFMWMSHTLYVCMGLLGRNSKITLHSFLQLTLSLANNVAGHKCNLILNPPSGAYVPPREWLHCLCMSLPQGLDGSTSLPGTLERKKKTKGSSLEPEDGVDGSMPSKPLMRGTRWVWPIDDLYQLDLSIRLRYCWLYSVCVHFVN